VPEPATAVSYPSATSRPYASATVLRARPRSTASVRDEGSRTPSASRPERTASRRGSRAPRAPKFSRATGGLDRAATAELGRVAFDPRLRELARIRASQLDGCAYCIDMHTKEARAIGETEQRLYALPAWRETPYLSTRERAALAFSESVTLLAGRHVPQEDYDAVAAEFGPEEIAALVSLIVAVNAWNTIGVGTHVWEPGSYQP
jgi:AhpD family alkylhydroperoxidase